MKLTLGVNFSNILQAAFLYEGIFSKKNFCTAYSLALYFFGKRILAENLLVKYW